MITFNNDTKTFHLQADSLSYVFRITSDGLLETLHFGASVSQTDNLLFLASDSKEVSFDTTNNKNSRSFEYSDYGSGDFRIPSHRLSFKNGSNVSNFTYQSHQTYNDQIPPHLIALNVPHFKSQKQGDFKVLVVTLVDQLLLVSLDLVYVVYQFHPSISRFVRFSNNSTASFFIEEANSLVLDFPPPNREYNLVHLTGAWGKERHPKSSQLFNGITKIESRRGASSHQHNPFVIITDGEPNEDSGDCYGIGLIYPSSFQFSAEITQSRTLRTTIGVHPEQFRWKLDGGESLSLPVAVLFYSGDGLANFTNGLHRFIKQNLVPSSHREGPTRPVLINSWEAMYFNCTEDEIMNKLVFPSKGLGIDLIVLDDGWFKNRNNDTTSLGDWHVDLSKFPNGLGGLNKKIRAEGFEFGIWMEPEMISKNSDLFRAHPDWALQTPLRTLTEGRNQLVLDLSRTEIQDFVIETVERVLNESGASYLKWDFNRHLTEIWSSGVDADRQGEVVYRWVQGLYRILDTFTKNFPNLLFESCSGGGGRFDLSLLYFSHQIWTSDNTDAISRVPIQLGTSLFYPLQSISAHVSVCPNHQVHRTTSWSTRHIVAFLCSGFGYEMNLQTLSKETREATRLMIEMYKTFVSPILFSGTFYRLTSIFNRNSAADMGVEAWMVVAEDKKRAVVFVVLTRYYEVILRPQRIKLKGLDLDVRYGVKKLGQGETWPGFDVVEVAVLSGRSAVGAGLVVELGRDADSVMFFLEAIE